MLASPSPSGYLMHAVWMEFAISFSTVSATCCLLLSAKSTTERAAAGVAPCSRCAGCLPSSSIIEILTAQGNRKLAASATEFVPSLNLKPQALHEQDREHILGELQR